MGNDLFLKVQSPPKYRILKLTVQIFSLRLKVVGGMIDAIPLT